MGDINRVTLLGRLGQNAELRYTQSGTPVISASVATSKNTAKYGEQANWVPTWHKVVIWGKRAELLANRMSKGAMVFIEGEIQVREYTDKEGIKKYSFEVVAKTAEIVDKVQSGESREPGSDDDDIPL